MYSNIIVFITQIRCVAVIYIANISLSLSLPQVYLYRKIDGCDCVYATDLSYSL